jgi:hypothetical protein
MRVIFFCSYYDAYLHSFYKKSKGLARLPYNEQMKALKDDHFGHWASFADEFVKLGVEAELVIPNCKPLQLAWAEENDTRYNERDWNFSIALAQVKKKPPDIFYISSMFEYYNGFLTEVKKHAKHIFGWISCLLPEGVPLHQLELLMTSVPQFVDDFRRLGVKSELLHAAFDPVILDCLDANQPQDIDFSFIGSLTKAHSCRITMIKELLDNTSLQFFGTGIELVPDTRNFFHRLFSKNIYRQRARGEVWGLDMYRTLHRSKITFNAHIDVARNFAGNMRMYEATGAGTLLLTDGRQAEQKNFNDDEVVYYESVSDAIEKVNYYLRHEEKRNAIAKKGQQRTLNDYNYKISSARLLDYFRQYMK